jgi:multidrug efflux pump subunit AcrB
MQRVGVNDAKALADVVIDGAAGAHVRLGTVAAVGEGFPPPIGDAVIDGGTGLLLIVEKQPWSNTLEVTRAVERTLSRLQQDLGDVRLDPTIFRPATFIEQALGNLTNALWIGCVLVVAVLLLFPVRPAHGLDLVRRDPAVAAVCGARVVGDGRDDQHDGPCWTGARAG